MATPTEEEDTRPKVLIRGEWRKVPDGYPAHASGRLEHDQLFINGLSMQLVAELRAACQLNPNPGAKPKSSDTKTNLIYKRASATTCSVCMFCGLYFPLPFGVLMVERTRLLLHWPHASALVAYNGGTSVGHGPVTTLFLGLILSLVPMSACETMLYWPSPN